MELTALLPILIPSVIAVIGSIIAALIAAKRGKESNNTDAFQAVTDQLFQLNTDLRLDLEKVKAEVVLLKEQNVLKDAENATLHHENGLLHEQMGLVSDELAEVKRRGAAVANYLGKLMRAWPQGTPMPPADVKIDWPPFNTGKIEVVKKE